MAEDHPSVDPSKDTRNCLVSPPRHDFMSTLSDPTYDILAFHKVEDLSQEEKLSVAKCMDKLLLAFLEDIGVQFHSPQRDDELRRDLWAWGRSTFVKICDGQWSQAEPILEFTATIIEYWYPLSRRDSRFPLALVISVACHVEKYAEDALFAKGLTGFMYDLLLQRKNPEDWYTVYSDVIRNFIEHFGANDPRIATFGAISLAQFIEIAYTEQRFSEKLPLHFSQDLSDKEGNRLGSSKGFPFFFRFLTGVPGPFITGIMKPSRNEEIPYDYWITSVVNLITFTNMANDLLSWPKEVRNGETANYMALQTRSRQQAGKPSRFRDGGEWTFRDTIYETLETVQAATADLDREFAHFSEYDPGHRDFARVANCVIVLVPRRNGRLGMLISPAVAG